MTSRHLANVAAAELRVNKDPVKAWEALQIIFDHQVMDPESDNFGVYTTKIWSGCYYGLECMQMEVPNYTKTLPSSFAGFEQRVQVGEGPHVLEWNQKRTYPYATGGYHLQQVLVDGAVVWQEQANSGEQSWSSKSIDLTEALSGKAEATVTMRLFEQRGVAHLPVKIVLGEISLSGTSLTGEASGSAWEPVNSGTGVTSGFKGFSAGDINQNSFTSLVLAGILNSKADMALLSPEQQELLRERALIGSRLTDGEPHAQITYTNARLIRDIHMMLIGQAADDAELYELGVGHFKDWLNYTKEWGIREYNSPVYYGVDIEALMMLHTYINDDSLRADAKWALDLFWWDMAANYFLGREVLAGSRSRDYDFVRGTGPSAYYLSLEGWQELPLLAAYTTFNFQKIQGFEGEHIYHPSPEHRELAFLPFKEVQAKTDPDRNLDRYTYVADDWALGSTSQTFTNTIPGAGGPTPYDKPIALDLAGSRLTGQISVVPSWNTDPYGVNYPGSAPLHAPLFPTSAQHEGALLTELDLNPSGQLVPKYSTSVLLPSDADLVLLDGEPVDMSVLGSDPASTSSTVVVRVDDACGAIRILRAAGVEGQDPRVSLVRDEAGAALNMARLEILQFESDAAKRLTTTSAPVAFYVQAASCTSDQEAGKLAKRVAQAPVKFSKEGDVRGIELNAADGSVLEVGTDTIAREPAFRLVDGQQVLAPSILTVNGVDVLTEGIEGLSSEEVGNRPQKGRLNNLGRR